MHRIAIRTLDLRTVIFTTFTQTRTKIASIFLTHIKFLVFCSLASLSLGSWYLSYTSGVSLAYSDSMSHLNLSRFIVDNLQPGFAQMGGVWLPINRIAALPFIWIDPLWHNGLAGTFVSMIAYIGSIFAIYAIMYHLSHSRSASVTAAATLALNPNALYLQTTPLTEMAYVGAFMLTVYAFSRWITTERSWYLALMGVGGFIQVLTRYDGWFVTIITGIAIGIHAMWSQKSSLKNALGKMLTYGTPVAFAIGLWLLWGLLIYNNPVYFAFGPHSARAQQSAISERTSLITKGDWGISALTYYYTLGNNVGYYLLIPALIGLCLYLLRTSNMQRQRMLLLALVITSPILFNILALYLGFSTINIPELNWRPTGNLNEQWFNVRYGIFALPAVAIGMGALAARSKGFLTLSALLIITQYAYLYRLGIITIVDGVSGSSAFAHQDIVDILKKEVKPEEEILLSTSYFNPVAFRSGRDLKQFIHEGAQQYWQPALDNPQNYAQWIVMANGQTGDPVYEAMIMHHNVDFYTYFKLEFKGAHANVYRLKTSNEMLVSVRDNNLVHGDQPYQAVGVNSYDLIYQDNAHIAESLQTLSANGVNTVRLWLFGEGTPDAVQPKAGEFNEARLRQFDQVLVTAAKHNIRVIPTLANNWTDYGGKNQYIRWAGLDPLKNESAFYTNPNLKQLYKNTVDHIVTRRNSITNQLYAEDPTILAWDLLNEPRFNNSNHQVVTAWTQEMASYLKSRDANHLLMIGTEQITPNPRDLTRVANLCEIKEIDLCSVHLYWYHDNKPWFSKPEEVTTFLTTQALRAQEIQKPLILGEFGIPKNLKPFKQNPLDQLTQTIQTAEAQNYQGYLLWNWSLNTDPNFGFAPQSNVYSTQDLRVLLSSSNN